MDDARRDLKLAAHLAFQAEQEDILHLALVSSAHLTLADPAPRIPDRVLPLKELVAAEHYADAMGLPRLKVEALRVRGEIILVQGDAENAGRLVARAVALANRHGMRLRKVSCLVLYARILHARGEPEFAQRILEEVLQEARLFDYQLKAELAARQLREWHAPRERPD